MFQALKPLQDQVDVVKLELDVATGLQDLARSVLDEFNRNLTRANDANTQQGDECCTNLQHQDYR